MIFIHSCTKGLKMGRPVVDLMGKTCGRLTVVGRSKREVKSGKAYWSCLCSCGEAVIARSDHLRSGRIVSCGCRKHEPTTQTHGMTGTTEYMCWCSMRQRCVNPNQKAYKNYGGRGIKICPEWDDFSVFLKDMGYAPKGLELDRIDNEGNYTPENCHWTTRKRNTNNRRSSVNIRYNGMTKTMSEWAEYLDKPYPTVANRLAAGWSTERTFETPTRSGWSERRRKK